MDNRPSFLSSKNDPSAASLENDQVEQMYVPQQQQQHYVERKDVEKKDDPFEKLKNNPLVLGLLVGIVIGIILTNMRPVIINPK